MTVKKLDNFPVQIPGEQPMDLTVNFRVVDSSNIDRVGWDDAENMYVQFHGGGLYAYMGVSRQRAVAMAYRPSVGSYFHRKIRGHYPEVKLR